MLEFVLLTLTSLHFVSSNSKINVSTGACLFRDYEQVGPLNY